MNYDNLTDDEAKDRLQNHDEADWDEPRLWNEVISPQDVLYWLDAFGDQSLAINCQGLPKDLPKGVLLEINEYDVLNDWTGSIEEHECPMCGRTLYEFDFKNIYPTIDEYGDNHPRVEYLSDSAGYYWDSTGEHSIMCQSCYEHQQFDGWRPEPSSNSVRVFYGESDEFSRFSHTNGIVRWDFEWDMDYDKSTDLYNLRVRDGGELISGQQIAAAFAEGRSSRDVMMERLGFERIHVKQIVQDVSGSRKFWRYAKDVLSGWAILTSATMKNEPTHPDLDFTYIIEGEKTAWVPSEHFDKFRAELVWQSLREASDYDRAEEFRERNDDLLSFGYYPMP